jgi:hypothetical protein
MPGHAEAFHAMVGRELDVGELTARPGRTPPAQPAVAGAVASARAPAHFDDTSGDAHCRLIGVRIWDLSSRIWN